MQQGFFAFSPRKTLTYVSMYGILMVEGHNLQELTVTNVVEIKLDNETDIEVIRRELYELLFIKRTN